MELIALSVLCSVSVSILLKLAPKYRWDVVQIITGGYLVAAILCWCFFNPSPDKLIDQASTGTWALLLALAILLPSIFIALAHSVKQVGIALTDAAQRLSLLLPLLAAFLIFQEQWYWLKGAGLLLGLLSIALILWRPASTTGTTIQWYWPVIVFVGMGTIDILFKQLAMHSKLPFTDLLFIVFCSAFLFMCLYLLHQLKQHKQQLTLSSLLAAIALGSFNFGNIFLYIKAHQQLAQSPAVVFAGMNIGVILLGTLVGVLVFKERLTKHSQLGLASALVALLILAASTRY